MVARPRVCSGRLPLKRANPALLGWQPGPVQGSDDQPAGGPLASYGRFGLRLRGDRALPRTKHGAIERELARSRMEPHHVARSLPCTIPCLSSRSHPHGSGDPVQIGRRIRRAAERGARRCRCRRDPRDRSLRLRPGSLSPGLPHFGCRIHAVSAREAAPQRGSAPLAPISAPLQPPLGAAGPDLPRKKCGRERKGAAADAAGLA